MKCIFCNKNLALSKKNNKKYSISEFEDMYFCVSPVCGREVNRYLYRFFCNDNKTCYEFTIRYQNRIFKVNAANTEYNNFTSIRELISGPYKRKKYHERLYPELENNSSLPDVEVNYFISLDIGPEKIVEKLLKLKIFK